MFSTFARCTARAPRSISVTSSFRTYATRPPRTAQPLKAKSTAPVSRPTIVSSGESAIDRAKRGVAARLFEEGQTILFTSPSHKSLLFACYLLTGGAWVSVLYVYQTKLWDGDKVKETGLPWFVSPAYKLTMMFLGFVGGWALTRSFNFITAIKLVKDRGSVKMLVTQRKAFPFLKPKQYIIEPYRLQIESEVVGYIENPTGFKTEVGEHATLKAEFGNIFSRMLWTPYNTIRKLFLHEGVMGVRVAESNDTQKLRLDVEGRFSNGGKDLLDLATIKY